MNERLGKSMVATSATIRDAMRSLEESLAQIVLVVDPSRRLTGTITDGDIRRALLAGAAMESPVAPHMNRKFFTVAASSGRAAAIELMQARRISQVPVVDDDGRVVGLHLLHEMLAAVERPNWAVVMAGGKGKRLGTLTENLPKPMLPVAGRPILERIVLHLVGNGVRRVFLSVNYLAEVIQNHFGDGRGFGCRIDYLREQTPLGTAGALSLLPSAPAHPVLVMNGDLVTSASVGALIDFHDAGGHAVTMAVRRYALRIPYGCVDTAGDELVAFEEKPTSIHLINAGMYVISPDVVAMVEPDRAVSLPQLVERVKASGRSIRVHEIDEDWIDVGRPDELGRARGER